MEPTKKSLSLLSCIFFDIYLVELVEKLTKVVLNVIGVVRTGILVLVCVDCSIHRITYITSSGNDSSRNSSHNNYVITCLYRLLFAAVNLGELLYCVKSFKISVKY